MYFTQGYTQHVKNCKLFVQFRFFIFPVFAILSLRNVVANGVWVGYRMVCMFHAVCLWPKAQTIRQKEAKKKELKISTKINIKEIFDLIKTREKFFPFFGADGYSIVCVCTAIFYKFPGSQSKKKKNGKGKCGKNKLKHKKQQNMKCGK